MPGAYHPDDFGNDPKRIEAAIRGARVAVDWWEPDARAPLLYYLRQRIRGVEETFHAGWRGECVLWSKDSGCALSFADRPAQCRALVPGPAQHCTIPKRFEKLAIARAWRPHQALLARLFRSAR